MKIDVQSTSSDKHNWKQYVFLSEKQRKELIDEKINRAMKVLAIKAKKK